MADFYLDMSLAPSDLVYPAMSQAERNAFCPTAPWYTAPVIIGGSGGSGTRGSVLLLQRLGVSIVCEDKDLLDPDVLGAGHCNPAEDFDLLQGKDSYRAPLVWLSGGGPDNSSCAATDAQMAELLAGGRAGEKRRRAQAVLSNATGAGSSANPARCEPRQACSLSRRLADLRRAVRPPFRRRLRWGMKNPHYTYMQKWLLRAFPCLVYVHTMRGLPEMVRTSEHLGHRLAEAAEFGLLPAGLGLSAPQPRLQAWLAGYLIKVNYGLARWGSRCLPGRMAFLPVMRVARCLSASCEAHHAAVLAALLDLEPNATRQQLHGYATDSHKVVLQAHIDAGKLPLAVAMKDGAKLRWPPGVDTLCGTAFCECE